MKTKLDTFEQAFEENMDSWTPIDHDKRLSIEKFIDKANEKKSISLRLKVNDLEQLKLRADREGLPYQTLLSSIIHKFVTDQLVDKRSILKSLELFKRVEGKYSA
ncbi:MAG: antitoxin [Deltaproteobacteria bacterium]|nr:antitoxin [Candidatus Tharpella aukensis]